MNTIVEVKNLVKKFPVWVRILYCAQWYQPEFRRRRICRSRWTERIGKNNFAQYHRLARYAYRGRSGRFIAQC